MLGQKRNDSLFGPGSRTIEAPQSVLEKQEAALEGSPLDEAVQPPFETQAPATAFTDADDLPRRTIATEAAAGQRVHSLFFTPESESKDFSSVLQDVQEYISGKYSTLITDGVGADTKEQIKRYISKYVQDRRIAVRDLSGEQLVDALYTEMAEFGFLTKYIFGSGIEEININSWRDIEVLYSSGQMVKLEEHFDSPDHAINVIRRMLHVSGMVLDNASPAVLGHLSKNIRIAVLKTPLVDEDVGVCASIRIVNPQNMQKEDFVRGGTATGPMLDFLSACLRYGVSVCVAGATGSGKTTVAGWLLTTIPDNKRIFTIENGSRELDLVREKNGRVTNSVIHTITRESENAKQSVDQDMLLDMALRYHPDIICVGEMRSAEAYAAQEAARTGHGVLTTIHSNSSQATWRRMVTLCKRKHEMADDMSLLLFVVGASAAIMLGNFFLVPVLAVGMMFVPFWFIKLTASYYKKNIAAELETALSIITTAYLRNEDIQTAVEENLEYLNPPVKSVFAEFLARIQLVDPDVDAALQDMGTKIDNAVFREWVAALLACQHDRGLKTILTPIVAKLSDMRIVNGELENMVFEPRKEFIIMQVLVVGNIPLLYFLNRDWFNTLMHTAMGQIILAVCAGVIFVSTAFVIKLTQPIEYRR